MRWALIACVLLGCSPCRRDDVLAEEGDARLVWVRGTGGGVAVGAPHAPVAIPYVVRFSNVRFVDATREVDVLDLDPESVPNTELRVDPSGGRFALGADGRWRLFFVMQGYAHADPDLLSEEPSWDDAPTLASRVVDVYAATSNPQSLLAGADLPPDTWVRVVRELFSRAPGERLLGAQEWAERGSDRWYAALERVPEGERASVLEPLERAYREPEATGVVLRRARWTLPLDALSVPAAVAARRVRDTELDDAERATALFVAPEPLRGTLACEVLRGQSDPILRAFAVRSAPIECLEPFVEAHGCESSLDCVSFGEEPAVDVPGPNLRDTHPDAVALALWRRCQASLVDSDELAARRARLRYRIDVRGGQPWDRIRRAACESSGTTFEVDGGRFVFDDETRAIRDDE